MPRVIYWFYEGHDVHWEAGAGCAAGAGDLFGRVEVAATGSGPATLYPDTQDGGWLLSGSLPAGEQWTQEVPGEALDLAAVATPAGARLAVLHAGTGTMVSLYSTTGSLLDRVRFGALEGPTALLVLQVEGAPALGVLASGPEGAGLTVRSLDGTWLATSLSGSTPSPPRPAAPATARRRSFCSAAAPAPTPAGRRPRRGGSRARLLCPAGGEAEDLALVSGSRPAVLWR